MKKCDEFIVLMNMHIDGFTDDSQEEILFAHLQECTDCMKRYKAYSAISTAIKNAEAAPPPELHEKIMAAVKREKQPKVLRFFKRYGGVAACLLVAITVAGIYGTQRKQFSGDSHSEYSLYENVAEEANDMEMYMADDAKAELARDGADTGIGNADNAGNAKSAAQNGEITAVGGASGDMPMAMDSEAVTSFFMPEIALADMSYSRLIAVKGNIQWLYDGMAEVLPVEDHGGQMSYAVYDSPDLVLTLENCGFEIFSTGEEDADGSSEYALIIVYED